MARPRLPDDLWAAIALLLPPHPPRPKGGRPRLDDRAALTGILFVLRSSIPWEMRPTEMTCGCGTSCRRRLRDWQAASVWRRLHRVLLERLSTAGEIDWSRASVDSASVPTKEGGCHRSEPDGLGQGGHQAPPRHRPPRNAAPGLPRIGGSCLPCEERAARTMRHSRRSRPARPWHWRLISLSRSVAQGLAVHPAGAGRAGAVRALQHQSKRRHATGRGNARGSGGSRAQLLRSQIRAGDGDPSHAELS